MTARIGATIIIFLAVLFLPFWITCLLALLGIIYFQFYLEAIMLILLSDLLFGVREVRFHGIVFLSFIIFSVVFVIVEILKKKLKFYT